MTELHTLDYTPEQDKLERMKDVASEMYELLKAIFVLWEIRAIIDSSETITKARELLAHVDGEEAEISKIEVLLNDN